MPELIAKPFSPVQSTGGSGITFSLREIKAGQYFQITLRLGAQEKLLGGGIDPKTQGLLLQLNSDVGKTHLLAISVAPVTADNVIPVQPTRNGGVLAKVGLWRTVAPGKRPVAALAVAAETGKGSVVVKLPDWARPDPVKKPTGSVMP